jgi:hypothetical protein
MLSLKSVIRFCTSLAVAAFLASALSDISASAAGNGLSLKLDADSGTYEISSVAPDWTFGGSFHFALAKVLRTTGHDQLGNYEQTGFAWKNGAQPMSGWIRVYPGKSLALFSQTCGTAADAPPPPFPDFTRQPDQLHVFSYGHKEFAPESFSAVNISTPWLLFDDSANAVVISPASHFFVASMIGDGQKQVASGFNPEFHHVPAGFTQQTLVAFGHGINATWDAWGGALLALQNAKRPSNEADTLLKYLGYWTDNGAFYYYNYDPQKGYAGTLQALVDHYRQADIPVRYLQLDSWWYYKTTTNADGTPGKEKKVERLPNAEWNRYGGLMEYRAHTNLFPNELAGFEKDIQLPLVTHNRWIDPASPYRAKYKVEGIAAVDPKFWDEIARYCKASGIVTYEQDWLDRIYNNSPFASELGAGEVFADNMARACREQNISVQYCMPYACYFMNGCRYENLTTIRTATDRFNTNRWNDFLYGSRFARSLGIWPWTDVFMSGETDNILLSTLSAGPVGIGDAIGAENAANLFRAVRADGVIVKPDAPLVPDDATYIADAQKKAAPLIAKTFTDHAGIRTEYIFAYNRHKTPADTVKFSADKAAYVYDYFAGTGRAVDAGAAFESPLAENDSAFYVVAPVGKSGIAFLGDQGKFVGTGKERIESLTDEPGRLTVGLVLAENEKSVVLHGFATAEPKATVLAGLDDAVQFNPATHYFTVVIKPEANTPVDKSSGDPVHHVTVVLEIQK